MLELILFGFGFFLVFEGIIYFLFANQMQFLIDILSKFKAEKIRFFSGILIISGLIFIYFVFKIFRV
jgi:uncharacterized protein YjeT (DUF2065 family)